MKNANILITKQYNNIFVVFVEGNKLTEHTVTVTEPYYQMLTKGRITKTKLLKHTFIFLLKENQILQFLRYLIYH